MPTCPSASENEMKEVRRSCTKAVSLPALGLAHRISIPAQISPTSRTMSNCYVFCEMEIVGVSRMKEALPASATRPVRGCRGVFVGLIGFYSLSLCLFACASSCLCPTRMQLVGRKTDAIVGPLCHASLTERQCTKAYHLV